MSIARWIELVEQKRVISQSEKKPDAGRPEGGVNAAARELGIQKNDAYRAVSVAGLSDEAKDAARETGLDAIAWLFWRRLRPSRSGKQLLGGVPRHRRSYC